MDIPRGRKLRLIDARHSHWRPVYHHSVILIVHCTLLVKPSSSCSIPKLHLIYGVHIARTSVVLCQHVETLLLVLDTSDANMIVDISMFPELIFIFFSDNNDFLLFAGLSLKLRSLSSKRLRLNTVRISSFT
jgi:hypothetical protein